MKINTKIWRKFVLQSAWVRFVLASASISYAKRQRLFFCDISKQINKTCKMFLIKFYIAGHKSHFSSIKFERFLLKKSRKIVLLGCLLCLLPLPYSSHPMPPGVLKSIFIKVSASCVSNFLNVPPRTRRKTSLQF